MSNFLADVLATDHPLFTKTIADFERVSGHSGTDTRLIADITEAAHRVMRELGIDTADTSGEELYLALNAHVTSGDIEKLLADPALHHTLMRFEDGPVSFCVYDVVENAHHELSYADRKVGNAQRHLRAEIIRRYAEHDKTNNTMIHELAELAGMKPPEDEGHPHPVLLLESGQEEAMENSETDVPKVLAVGDIISDAFIKLNEDVVKLETDEKGYKRLSFELGAKLPYDQVDYVTAVECSPNAAVSMTRLGLDVSLMTWIGDDAVGSDMITYLKNEGVGTDDMVVEKGMKSNYHYVLRYGADRTKFQKFEDYSYEWHDPAEKPNWLYLGVLGEKTWPLHEAMLKYLDDNADVKLVFQPGMYHLMWGTEKMAPFYKRAELVILNREEAAEVTGKDRADLNAMFAAMHEMGVKKAVITDGGDGAYASDGTKILFMPNYPDPAPPLDRTGAGDAFASTIATATALGESLDVALTWAPINSMSVVQKMGAQAGLLKRDELKKYLAEAPEDYKPKEM